MKEKREQLRREIRAVEQQAYSLECQLFDMCDQCNFQGIPDECNKCYPLDAELDLWEKLEHA